MNLPLPNYTQVPNYIIDEWMAKLTHAEFKVIMLILRYTVGYHRREASISYGHFEEKCGVSKKWVRICCLKFESLGWISIEHGDEVSANKYQILLKSDPDSKKDRVGYSEPQGGVLSTSGVGYSVPPINKEKEKLKENNNEAKPQRAPPSVVVSSVLINLKIPDALKKKLSKNYTNTQLERAVLVLSTMRPDNYAATLQAALKEGWEAKKSPLEQEKLNNEYLQSIKHLDGTEEGRYTMGVYPKMVLFRHSRKDGSANVAYGVIGRGFIENVKSFLAKHFSKIGARV